MDNKHNGSPDASSDVAQWAWAAGFFDGEGTVGVQKNHSKTSKNPSFSLKVKVSQDDSYPLEKIKVMVGAGAICKYVRIRERKGKMQQETHYSYEVTGTPAKMFLQGMLPFLTVKKKRAEFGIKFREMIESRKNTGCKPLTPEQVEEGKQYYLLMKNLNKPKVVACSSND